MSILVTSDLHLSDNARDQYRHNWMNKLPKLIRRHKVSELYILGDLTEEKDNHCAELVNQIVAHIYELAQIVPVTILRGNHDYLRPDYPFFGFVSTLENVTYVNTPMRVDHEDLGQIIFLPHTNDYRKDWKDIAFDPYNYIFAHSTFKGARSETGHLLEGVPLDVFPKHCQIISGDIHLPQQIDNLVYVGAPYTVDFGDNYEPRVLVIKDEESVYDVPCRRPQKMLVTINHDDPDGVDWVRKFKLRPQDILKVRVVMEPEAYENWPSIQKAIRAWADDEDMIVHAIVPEVDQNVRRRTRLDRSRASKSDSQVLKGFAKWRKLDGRTIKAGLQIMEKA